MKVYNKKSLIIGIVLCVMGVYSLVKDLITPSNLMIIQIKNFVISFLILSIGLNSLIQAFFNKCTKKDIATKNNERNRMVKLESQSVSFVIFQALIFIGIILSIVVFHFTENLLAVIILIILGLLLSMSWIVELITTIYYKNKQQGEKFK